MIHNQHLKVSNRNYWNAKKRISLWNAKLIWHLKLGEQKRIKNVQQAKPKSRKKQPAMHGWFLDPQQKYGKGKEQQRNTP